MTKCLHLQLWMWLNVVWRRQGEEYLVITSKQYDKTVDTLGVGGGTIDLWPQTFPCVPYRPYFFPQRFVPKHGFDAHDLKPKPLVMMQVGDNETICDSCLLRAQLLLRIAAILVAGLRQVVKLQPRTSKHYGNAVQARNSCRRHRPKSPFESSRQSPPAFSRQRRLRRGVCWCWHHSLRNLAFRSSAAVPSC
jgi:hypothetical protein